MNNNSHFFAISTQNLIDMDQVVKIKMSRSQVSVDFLTEKNSMLDLSDRHQFELCCSKIFSLIESRKYQLIWFGKYVINLKNIYRESIILNENTVLLFGLNGIIYEEMFKTQQDAITKYEEIRKIMVLLEITEEKL